MSIGLFVCGAVATTLVIAISEEDEVDLFDNDKEGPPPEKGPMACSRCNSLNIFKQGLVVESKVRQDFFIFSRKFFISISALLCSAALIEA
jgi:hypothetical protein